MSWRATVLTIFPEMFPGPLATSVIGRALRSGIWRLDAVGMRDFAIDNHQSVDDAPFGGGAGMVMRPDVVAAAIDHARARGAVGPKLCLSPRGQPFDQSMARRLAAGPGALMLCGRFEGIDQRVLDGRDLVEVSIGDFVLSGGEIAAMALLDAVIRLLPGVVGNDCSLSEESFDQGLLEYPHFTRPQVWEGRSVPEVLVSGHHEKIRTWRRAAALDITRRRRPDLLSVS